MTHDPATFHKHTVIAWLEDKPGVLSRVLSLFRRRNFNIENLSVGHSETPGVSRLTFTVNGDDQMVEQAIKQLYKLINVLRVQDVTNRPAVRREMALVRIQVDAKSRPEVMQLVDIYRASIVDVSIDSLVVQAVGDENRLNSLLDLLSNYQITEMVRTGPVAMSRGQSGKNGAAQQARRLAL
jgi:acetolactate synthase-1/3 small subunit